MKKNLFLLAAAAIVAGCSNDETTQMTAPAAKPAASELQQIVFGSTVTRAHWEIGESKLNFVWDEDNAGTELVCAIASESGFIPGYKVNGSEVGEAEYTSYLTIKPDADDAGIATFTTVNGFHKDTELAGKTIHAVTPVLDDKVTGTAEAFSVEMSMPNSFTQTAEGDLTHLRSYMQMYATATLEAGDNHLSFNHIPATLGFNIVNSGTSAVTVNSVTIDAVEAANGVIAAPLSASAATYSATDGLTYSTENTHTAVTTVLGDGVTIDASDSYLAYALVLPLGTDAALQNAYLRVRVTTTDGTYTLYTLSGEQLKEKAQTDTYDWKGGKFYGFTLTIPELNETACTLPKGATFITNLYNALGECTKVRFVAGSAKTSDTVFGGTSGSTAYIIANDDWLEIHTPAKKIMANSTCKTMFKNETLEAIDFGCNFSAENVTTMESMFRDCSKLQCVDFSGFNTSNLTSLKEIFRGCYALSTIRFGQNFVTTNVTTMSYSFRNCSKLTELDLTSFVFDNVTDYSSMLQGTGDGPVYVTEAGYKILKDASTGISSVDRYYDKSTGKPWSEIIAAEGETTE